MHTILNTLILQYSVRTAYAADIIHYVQNNNAVHVVYYICNKKTIYGSSHSDFINQRFEFFSPYLMCLLYRHTFDLFVANVRTSDQLLRTLTRCQELVSR